MGILFLTLLLFTAMYIKEKRENAPEGNDPEQDSDNDEPTSDNNSQLLETINHRELVELFPAPPPIGVKAQRHIAQGALSTIWWETQPKI